jgi:hypothetical protein
MSKWVFEKRHSIVIAVFVLLSIAFVTLFYRTDLRKSLLVAKHDVGIDNIDAIKATINFHFSTHAQYLSSTRHCQI